MSLEISSSDGGADSAPAFDPNGAGEPVPNAEATVEGQPAGEPAKTDAVADKATKRFEAAMRREQQAEARERAAQERIARADQFDELAKSFKENPMGVLSHLGVTMEELIDHAIKTSPAGKSTGPLDQDSVQKLVAEEIAKKTRELEASHQEREQARAVAEWEQKAARVIAQDPELSEFFSDEGVKPRDILEVIHLDFERKGGQGKATPMTIEAAVKLVEEHLVGQRKAHVAKLQRMARFGGQPQAATTGGTTAPATPQTPAASPRPVAGQPKPKGYETDLSGRISVRPVIKRADDGKYLPRKVKR